MQNTTLKWYAVYTKPRCEKRVAHLLKKKNIENYCPLSKVQRQWSDRKKTIEVPLFTSYVFVRITPEQQQTVLETDNIFNFVYWIGKPAIIRDEEIITIKDYLSEHESIQLEKIEVNVDDIVRIKHGPLMYKEGKITDVMQKIVKVMLPSLGYALVVSIDKRDIVKLDTATTDENLLTLQHH